MKKLIYTSPRDYVGVEESHIGSPTFISELVPRMATAGAYLSRSLRKTRPKDLIVVPESMCDTEPTTAAMAKKDNDNFEPYGQNQPTHNDFYEMLCQSISRTTYSSNDFHEPRRATISRASVGNDLRINRDFSSRGIVRRTEPR